MLLVSRGCTSERCDCTVCLTMASMMATNRIEIPEHIEWDLPLNDGQGSDVEYIDFSKLSMGTELRNKMWEDDNKSILNSYQEGSSSNSPLFDQNQNLTNEISHYMNGNRINGVMSRSSANDMFSAASIAAAASITFGNYQQALNTTATTQVLGKPMMRNQPLLQSPIPMPTTVNTPELLSSQEDDFLFDGKKVSSLFLKCKQH